MKQKIEQDPSVSPLAKLLARYLADLPLEVRPSSEVSAALATSTGMVVEACHELRRVGVLVSKIDDVYIPLSQILMTKEARDGYAPKEKK